MTDSSSGADDRVPVIAGTLGFADNSPRKFCSVLFRKYVLIRDAKNGWTNAFKVPNSLGVGSGNDGWKSMSGDCQNLADVDVQVREQTGANRQALAAQLVILERLLGECLLHTVLVRLAGPPRRPGGSRGEEDRRRHAS